MYFLIYNLIYFFELLEHPFRKFVDDEVVDTLDVNNVEVKTRNGYVPIKHIHITAPSKIWLLRFKNGYVLASDEHPFKIIRKGEEMLLKLKELNVGDLVISDCKVISITEIKKLWWLPKIKMCDISVESESKLYFINGILTHNCVAPETFIYIEVPEKGYLEIPIFEAYYMLKKKLTITDRFLRMLYRINFSIYMILRRKETERNKK